VALLEVQNFSANKELYVGSAADEIHLAPGSAVPEPLAEIATLPERFNEVVDAGRDGIEGAVKGWLRL